MRFVSRQKEYRLIIRPTEVILDESRRPRIIPGEKVEFHGGIFLTEDPGLIDYLCNHPAYGVRFTSDRPADPRPVAKAPMVFDDGADLSGPKIVAGFPERVQPAGPQMITGATSTVHNPVAPPVTNRPNDKVYQNQSSDTFVSKEEVEALIENKLDAFLGKIESLIVKPKASPQMEGKPLPEPVIKGTRKKLFSCPYCREPFDSNIKVGRHKKVCPQRPTD